MLSSVCLSSVCAATKDFTVWVADAEDKLINFSFTDKFRLRIHIIVTLEQKQSHMEKAIVAVNLHSHFEQRCFLSLSLNEIYQQIILCLLVTPAIQLTSIFRGYQVPASLTKLVKRNAETPVPHHCLERPIAVRTRGAASVTPFVDYLQQNAYLSLSLRLTRSGKIVAKIW